MTVKIGIATSTQDMHRILRTYLLEASRAEGAEDVDVFPQPLTDPDQVNRWMVACQKHLLVVHVEDPKSESGTMGTFYAARAHNGGTPVLFIVRSREEGEALEEHLTTRLGNC